MSIIINGEEVPRSFSENHVLDGLHHFKNRDRTSDPTVVVIHETAGHTYDGMVRTLRRRKLGIHFALSRGGFTYQHADPVLDVCSHARGLNRSSIGIEIVNPYLPSRRTDTDDMIIFGQKPWWLWDPTGLKQYIAPTDAQLDSLYTIVQTLIDRIPSIPRHFPTIKNTYKVDPESIEPGVVAHCDFGAHADGRYPLEQIHDRFMREG